MTDIEHEHELTVQSLKQKMIALRNEQSLNQQANNNHHSNSNSSRSCQTPAPDQNALRQQYESILHNVRGECLSLIIVGKSLFIQCNVCYVCVFEGLKAYRLCLKVFDCMFCRLADV